MSGRVNNTIPIQSTAGAVTIKNEKGDITMQKVKVNRYVTGKRPDYAPDSSSEEEEEVEFNFGPKKVRDAPKPVLVDNKSEDPRLRRLKERTIDDDSDVEDRVTRHRREVIEPEVVMEASEDEMDDRHRREEEESSEEEELDEEEIERRRELLRQRALQRKEEEEEEVMDLEDEKSEGESDEESSEYEEYTDSEEETGPRLKPVFVRKKDRITIQEKEKEDLKAREQEIETKRMVEERRRQTLKIIETEARKELEETKEEDPCDAVDTGDENDEEEYEAWKVRELKRMKRDREEREALEKEKGEIDRLRNMNDEERRSEQRANPKIIPNKAPKGRYKFLQKYYHRGAFFMDEEDTVYKRDFSAPTLEDHFDKTILPKVMQVKNFGRSGRTKYTHLVDQDTTQFDSPWLADTAQNLKFHTSKGGGMKQVFERPSVKKRK
ncbi:microfibrillar-associated protein 1 [Octopus bimaculoides]|uniref:Micro-fibrillar-associated protein 1 C-terminal domain-containing protein n=1 Tax=Octopus bimaculoides TaxID=37653 RepID=A0A0L8H394_OCTBM|nr:microfibrillar-associated protein 1 [Octopus bimaculoides]|eukprot:XP_014775799.1 PREDICTED: microfibrillar-associated protein 1-like [Octopus bimaculoides]